MRLETMPNPAEIGRDCGKVVRVRMPIRSSMTHPVRSRSGEIVEMELIFISAGWYCYADAVDIRFSNINSAPQSTGTCAARVLFTSI